MAMPLSRSTSSRITGEGDDIGSIARKGDSVNLEIDVLARYLKRMQALAEN